MIPHAQDRGEPPAGGREPPPLITINTQTHMGTHQYSPAAAAFKSPHSQSEYTVYFLHGLSLEGSMKGFYGLRETSDPWP